MERRKKTSKSPKSLIMKLKSIFILTIAANLLTSCGKDPFCNCLESTGRASSETRTVDPFNTLEVFNNVNVNWHQSSEYKLVVSCGSNLLDGIETEVEGGVLKIRNKNRCNWMRDPGNVYLVDVYSPGIGTIICRTVGDITCTCPVASTAATPAEIITETAVTDITERGATRMDDQTSEASMERRKKEGYF